MSLIKGHRDVFNFAKNGAHITRPAFISLTVNGKPMVFCWALDVRFTRRVENEDDYLLWKHHF